MSSTAKLIQSMQPAADKVDDAAGICALEQALVGAQNGTYGVGAVLLNGDGKVVCEGYNMVYPSHGKFRSDLHAEMVLLNKFEESASVEDKPKLSDYTLVSTLEPCPMCMTRIIFAGIGKIKYLCPDEIGGMVQRKTSLPPIFQELTQKQNQVWASADCSPALTKASFDIWDESRAQLDAKVVNRSKGEGYAQEEKAAGGLQNGMVLLCIATAAIALVKRVLL